MSYTCKCNHCYICNMTTWLLIHYKLPTKPSALRAYIWRKLKLLGAMWLHEAIWVVPDQPRTAEQIQWLTAEIQEMGGDVYYWKANTVSGEDDESMVEQFKAQVDAVYASLLIRLE